MGPDNRITVATSIPPKLSRLDAGREIGGEYQRLCIRSWLDCGFRVISVNPRDEVAELAARYPEIEFVATGRDARAISGRKTPFIADLLTALLATQASCLGIINADLVFEPGAAWQDKIPDLVGPAVLTAHRYDTCSLAAGALDKYYWGLDCFFFDRDAAKEFAAGAGNFAMGLPWWDCWLPAFCEFGNRKIAILERPAVAHLMHPQGYPGALLRQFSYDFANFVLDAAEKNSPPVPAGIAMLLDNCRAMRALSKRSDAPAAEDQRIDEEFKQRVGDWRRAQLSGIVGFEPNTDAAAARENGGLVPASVFQRMKDRVWAGEALGHAKYLRTAGQFRAAAQMFEATLTRTPDDLEALTGLGEVLCQASENGAAIAAFERARLLHPDSAKILNGLGFALRGAGRREEAAHCFEHVVNRNPGFQEAYFNLAITLYEMGRDAEAVARLDAALARWPEASEFEELRRHFSQVARLR